MTYIASLSFFPRMREKIKMGVLLRSKSITLELFPVKRERIGFDRPHYCELFEAASVKFELNSFSSEKPVG